ncbi:MAG: BamA/TamA family outer membrane protein [Polyangia bacterium]
MNGRLGRRAACTTLLALAALAGCHAEQANGRPWIHDIRFIGVHSVKPKDLKSKISVQKTSWIPWSPKKYLDPYAVPGDRVRVEAFYRDQGYYGAHVTKAETIKRKSKKPSVDIVFTVDEGQPVHITQLEIHGLEALGKNQKKIEKLLPLRLGQTFVHDTYMNEKSLLENRLELLGHPWPKVTGIVDVDRDSHTAAVTIDSVPGPIARIGTIRVEGEKQTRALDIWRTADLYPGRLYSPNELETARGRVYAVGVYGNVRVTLEHSPSDPHIANVVIHVQEAQFHELKLGGGVSIETQRNDVHLLAQYTKRNFLGGMRTLTLKLEPGFAVVPAIWRIVRYGPTVSAEATFRQPFVFGVHHLDFHWTVGYDLNIDYAFQYHGPRSSLGLNFSTWRDRVKLGLSYNIQFLDFFNTNSSFSTTDTAQAGTLYGYLDPYRVAWLQQDISLDLRDKVLDTHYGAYLLASLEEGGVYTGSAFTYQKIVPDARFYVPLGHRLTFAARIEYGKIWSQGDVGSPITRRLYLGGPDSHRGFNFNRLSYQVPADCPIGLRCTTNTRLPPLPIGGDQMFLVQGELRLHIVKLFGNWFGAVAFIDGGDVSLPSTNKRELPGSLKGAKSSIDYTNLHWAVGAGLRYATVIGTIRFDLGVRLNRLGACTGGGTYDRTDGCSVGVPNPDPGLRFAYHISVGEAF